MLSNFTQDAGKGETILLPSDLSTQNKLQRLLFEGYYYIQYVIVLELVRFCYFTDCLSRWHTTLIILLIPEIQKRNLERNTILYSNGYCCKRALNWWYKFTPNWLDCVLSRVLRIGSSVRFMNHRVAYFLQWNKCVFFNYGVHMSSFGSSCAPHLSKDDRKGERDTCAVSCQADCRLLRSFSCRLSLTPREAGELSITRHIYTHTDYKQLSSTHASNAARRLWMYLNRHYVILERK